MALSAVLSTTAPSTVPAGYVVNCYITVTNSATNSVTLQDIEPAIKSTPITFLEDKSSWSVSPVSLVNNPVPEAVLSNIFCESYFMVQIAAVRIQLLFILRMI